jgi:hypothetical protein
LDGVGFITKHENFESEQSYIQEDDAMATITDDYMRQMLATTKSYCIVILKAGPRKNEPGLEQIKWEHGRRNFSLRADGVLSIVCPIADGSDVTGIGIFNTSLEEVKKIMDDDPGVKARVFSYEAHECRSFPGDRLPG